MLDAAWRRAIRGRRKAIVYKGKVTGEVLEQDNKLLVKLLEQYKPEFAPQRDSGEQLLKLTPEELYERVAAMQRMREVERRRLDGPE